MTGNTGAIDDAVALLARMRAGELSVVDAVTQAVARARAVEPRLNAIVEPALEAALEQAEEFKRYGWQSLPGLPFLYKDYCVREGDPASQGNALLKSLKHRYAYSGNAARRLDMAGVISLGRTHAPELTNGNCAASSETALYGFTRNPWDPSRTPMGSSGGAAAAVAAGIVPIAHASDGGGSIRMPASACGLVGLKPSRGRISSAPDGDGWGGGTTEGVLTRTVRDTALALDVLAGPEPTDALAPTHVTHGYAHALTQSLTPLRIGVAPDFAHTQSAKVCREAVLKVGKLLESRGHQVEFEHPEALDSADYMRDYIKVIQASTAVLMARLESVVGRPWAEADMEPGSWEVYQRGLRVSGRDVLASMDALSRWSREVLEWWRWKDVLITPTLGDVPPPSGTLVTGELRERTGRLVRMMPFTPQFNVTGQPAISLPLHWTDEGLPVGVQLVGGIGREDLLLQLAAQLEQLLPWHDRRPAVWAGA